MLPYFWYILKVIICSGILFGYYWLFLRNKVFHQYNRFYLLAALTLSLLLPLLKIDFWQPDESQSDMIRALQVVSAGDEYMNNVIVTADQGNWSIQQLYPLVYWMVSLIFLLVLLQTIFIIRSLLKKYPVQLIDNFSFINTNDKSTPFSFLKYIFWNEGIDLETATGKQIFKHEVAHIQEKHTYDKLFINILLIFFWCNPFFWLYRKELNMIHEFIADKKAVEDSDTASFAAMILQAAYPQHRFQLTNNFFYSPIKRRLLMLTKNNNPRVNYLGRVMVLPLMILIFAAFSLKQKTNIATSSPKLNTISEVADQPVTILQLDNLLKSSDDIMSAMDTVPNKNSTITLRGSSKKPLFILDGVEADSNVLHTLDPNTISSINVLKGESAFVKYGEKANNGVIEITLKKNEQPQAAIISAKFSVFYIGIDNPVTIAAPGIPGDQLLVSMNTNNGTISGRNGKYIVRVTTVGEAAITVSTIKNDERVILLTKTFQKKRVPDPTDPNFPDELKRIYKLDSSYKLQYDNKQKLLEEQEYLVIQDKTQSQIQALAAASDAEKTLKEKKVQELELQYLKQKIILDEQNKSNLALTQKQLELKTTNLAVEKAIMEKKLTDQELHYLKQKIILDEQNKSNLALNEKQIELKQTELAAQKILLTQKEHLVKQNNLVFSKVEINPQFTGGEEAWSKYLHDNLNSNTAVNNGAKAGKYTVVIMFIVKADGSISDVLCDTDPGYGTCAEAIRIMKNTPKWQPAMQNGKKVNAWKRQPITFIVKE